MPAASIKDLPPETIKLLKHHNLLRALINNECVEKAVENIELTQEEYDQPLKSYLENKGIKTDSELENHLNLLALSLDDLNWQLQLPCRINKFCLENFSQKAEARFLAKKQDLDKVIYSLLRVKDRYLAQELYLRISGGESRFEELAKEYSLGPEKKTKGIVGPVPLNKSHKTLSDKLRISQPGELLEPFSIQDWWLVVRLERYDPARVSRGHFI